MSEKKRHRILRVSIGLFVVAGLMLMFAAIGGARATLTYFSNVYTSQFEMKDIGVTLNENGKAVSVRDYLGEGKWKEKTGELLSKFKDGKESYILGKSYPEELSVTNSGEIDEYVKVNVYRYWIWKGDKDVTLSPDLIDLHFLDNAGWVIDKDASGSEDGDQYKERTVLYYTKPLPVGATTPALSDTLVVNNQIASKVRQETTKEGERTRIKTIYEYDGVEFAIEADAYAVQTHNAVDAIKSAWGRDVKIADDSSLSLIN